ncbi:MAG TPA: hypothetical protein PKO06_10655, partial [Candidatus Ozemobacteraceae bacterium]|nr:hypothetical protein [Candidatus Ozemobacteraceae bacterium]
MNWKNRLIGLLLLLLPVILSLLGRQLLYEDPMQLARERLDERLETAFAEIEAGRGFAEHFTRTFRQFERQVFSASEPARVLPSLVARIEDTYRVKLQGVLLDGRGVPIREFLDRPVSRQLIQRFFHAYQAFVNTGKPLPSIEQGFVKSFLGRFVPVATQIHGRFLFASADPQRSYLYMSAPRPRGMLFLFFHVETQPTSLAAQELIRTIMSRDPRLRLCFRGVDEVATRTAEALKLPVEQIPEILAALEQSATGSLWLGNTLVKRRILEPSMSVIGAADVLPPLVWWDHWPRVLLGTMLSLGGLLLFVLLLERPFAESVRFKLIGAFLYSSLLPLIIMGLSALSALEEQRRVLERETHQRIENDLFRFDQEFDQFVGTLRGGLMTRYFQDVDGRGASLTTFLEQLERVEKSWRFDTCVVYDRSGTLVFEHQVKGGRPVLGNVVVSFGKLAKTVLSRTIRRAPEATEKSREDSLFESLSASPHLNMIDWGALKFYFGILPFGDLPDSVTHLAALFWHPSRMQHHFLADRLMTFNRYIGDGEIFVWSHTGEGPPLPPDSPRAGILRPLLGRVTSWAVGLRRKVKINDQVYLATGLRFRMLSEFSAIRLTPDLLIQRQVDAVS